MFGLSLTVEAEHRRDFNLVVRVDENQVLGEEDAHDVLAVYLVHRDAGEAALVDVHEHLERQSRVRLHHKSGPSRRCSKYQAGGNELKKQGLANALKDISSDFCQALP